MWIAATVARVEAKLAALGPLWAGKQRPHRHVAAYSRPSAAAGSAYARAIGGWLAQGAGDGR
jgi:hypothetical protein